MKRFLATTVIVLSVITFAMQHGWGGFTAFYIPGTPAIPSFPNIPSLIQTFNDFTQGIFCSGGMGFGGSSGFGFFYGGGFGGDFERTVTIDGQKRTFKTSAGGGFGGFAKALDLGIISLIAGLGIGGIDFTEAIKVNEGNISLADFKNGTLEGYLEANISYMAAFPMLMLYMPVLDPFASIAAGVVGMLGYSGNGWLVNGKTLQGVDPNAYRFYMGYTIFAGVYFGG